MLSRPAYRAAVEHRAYVPMEERQEQYSVASLYKTYP